MAGWRRLLSSADIGAAVNGQIGTDTNIDCTTSEAINQINVTDGVITSMSKQSINLPTDFVPASLGGTFSAPVTTGNFTSTGTGAFTGAITWDHGGSAEANTAYGWGDHASGGYASSGHNHSGVYLANQGIGIADNRLVEMDSASAASGEIARFTANGLESRSNSEMLTQLGLSSSDQVQFDEVLATSIEVDGDPVFHENSVIPIANGGTGVATAAAVKNLLNVNTGSDLQIDSFGVGTAASGTSGEIRATNEITAYYSSDVTLKTNIKTISNPLEKLMSISGYNFDWKDKVIKGRGGEDGFFVRKKDVGILAHEINHILPEIVVTREDGTQAVKYEKIVPLLIESIKELTSKVTRLENVNSK